MRGRILVLVLGIAPLVASGGSKPPPDPADEYAARAGKLSGKRDPKAWIALADFAEEHRLWPQHEEALHKAVSDDPDNVPAHDRLGEARVGKDWLPAGEAEAREEAAMTAKGLVFYGTRWVSPKEADTLRAGDRKAVGWDCDFRLDTPALRIYSAKPLAAARRMAALFQSALGAYQRLHAGIWRLRTKPDPFCIYLFADHASFERSVSPVYCKPTGPTRVPDNFAGFYCSSNQIVYVGESLLQNDPADADCTAVHEFLHALDHQLAGLNVLTLPRWLAEGRANHFGFSVRGRQVLPGEVRIPAGKAGLLPQIHALPLTALVTSTTRTFDTGDVDMVRNYVASWAFVHFLRYAEGGRHAAGFRKFLAGLPGKASPKDLEAALGTAIEPLEPSFRAYVSGTLLPAAERETAGPSPVP